MGSSLKRRPRRGQLTLLSNDEHDVLTLDEDTKAIGKQGVSAARATLEAARRSRLAAADPASAGRSTSTIHEEAPSRAGTYAPDMALARGQ